MSLGWNTESALLPSKAKAIDVSQSSMLDLKAIVFEREEQRRHHEHQQPGSSRDGSGHSDWRRQRRGERGLDSSERPSRSESVFARNNRGVEERGAADEVHRQAEKVRKRGNGVLEQKAALYDQLKKGSIAPEAAQEAGFLVDFDQGRLPSAAATRTNRGDSNSASSSSSGESSASGDVSGAGRGGREREMPDGSHLRPSQFTLNPGEVEIEDEFGREMVVSVGSAEHGAFLRRQNDLKRSFETSSTQHRHQLPYEGSGDSAQDSKRRRDGASSSYSSSESSVQWPVSSGVGRADCGDAHNAYDGAGGGGEGGSAGGLLDFGLGHPPVNNNRATKSYDPIDGSGGGGDSVRGVQGGVKSKWELATLSAEEKEHLKVIMAETAASRAALGARARSCGSGSGGGDSGSARGGAPVNGAGASATPCATTRAAPTNASTNAGATTSSAATTSAAPNKRDLKADRRELLRQKAAARELAIAEARRKEAESPL